MSEKRYWMIVASKNHILRGVQAGVAQANHGKAAPLKRMHVHDRVLYYSPKVTFEGNEKLQAFTAIADVVGEAVYPFDMGGGFVPYRRDVKYLACNELPIRPLIPTLTFIKNKSSWGVAFRYGFFEIPKADFDLIAGNMVKEKANA
ncbi:MAG: EVE domain-containing protein [Anaerolineales bacterium]|nr:EVE domain-containing protein [Anaerolineales bacterium]